jgi:hypothetical protein
MATNPRVTAPAHIPDEEDGSVTVTFDLDPGTGGTPINVQLLDHAGAVLDEQAVMLGGEAPEQFPTIRLAGEQAPGAGEYVLILEGGESDDKLVRGSGDGAFIIQNR